MTLESRLILFCDGICMLLCLLATISDLRTMRIPNRLTYSGVLLGIALNFGLFSAFYGIKQGFIAGAIPSLGGCLFLFVVFGLISAVGAVGRGDVKLMAAVGAFIRWPLCVKTVLYVLIAGGVISIVYTLARGQTHSVLSNLILGGKALISRRRPKEALRTHRIPYGTAILAGTVWAVLSRHFF